MRRYYLLMGYLIPAYSIDKLNRAKHKKSQTHVFLKLSPKKSIYISFHDLSENGHFLIKANSRKDAYYIADIIRGFYTIFYGWLATQNDITFYLEEFQKIPKTNWGEKGMIEAMKESYPFIKSGCIISKDSLNDLKDFISKVYNDPDLCESMNHLLESRFLFNGFMTDSYYYFDYPREREHVPKWIMHKKYFENKYRYETAFVAAFKGIERYFKVNGFKKTEIRNLFNSVNYNNVTFDTTYTRWYEIFLGAHKKISYGKLLNHFLVLRNAVAAHGNKKPPIPLIEDNIYEIQLFLVELISKAVHAEKPKTDLVTA